MTTPVFDKDTWLDISVNVIPLCIIAFFVGLFALASPWEVAGLPSAVAFALLVVPFLALAALTYVAADRIESSEE